MRSPSRSACVLLALLAGCLPPAAATTLAAARAELQAMALADRLLPVQNLRLQAGPASILLEAGSIVPTSTVAGEVVEFVFVGEGRIELTPTDPIEAHQLEMFTGAPTLGERFKTATLVVAHDSAGRALAAKPPRPADHATLERARREHATWRQGAVRRLLHADLALTADALGEPGASAFFVAWIDGTELGRFLYVVEPRNEDQVTLGAFVPLDLSERERRQARREVRREQRRGRFAGITLDDLGTWDTWLSQPLEHQGEQRHGSAGFEPEHYRLDVRLAGRALDLSATATIEMTADASAGPIVRCRLFGDLVVDAARDHGGGALPFAQERDQLLVVLPTPPTAGQRVTIAIDYHGPALAPLPEDLPGATLRDTEGWYPHVGDIDFATYDVSFRWPERFELLAMGDAKPEARGGGERTRRFGLPHRTKFYTFEIGKFERLQRTVGRLDVTLALDAFGAAVIDRPELVLDWIADVLPFFEQSFGPLPTGQMTVVTTPRLFSQAPLGFATLSTFMLTDHQLDSILGKEDPRSLIAHELSHQWWGHLVSWRSERDRWLSEALATYSAQIYARAKLRDRRLAWPWPTDAWRDQLSDVAKNGALVEALGPVVIGDRLVSSLSDSAYNAIVYTKGALVLDQLARLVGEEQFHAGLRALTKRAFSTISTGELLERLAAASGTDLRPFAQRYIYGTGVPLVIYRYRAEPAPQSQGDQGGHTLIAEFERGAVSQVRYRALLRDGRLEIARELAPQPSFDQLPVGTPFTVELEDASPEAHDERPRTAAKREASEGKKISGNLVLGTSGTPARIELAAAPRRLELNPKDDALGVFWDRTKGARSAQIRLATRLELLGRRQEAAEVLEFAQRAAEAGEDKGAVAAATFDALLASAGNALYARRLEDSGRQIDAARAALKRVPNDERKYRAAALDALESFRLYLAGDSAAAQRLLEPLAREGGALDWDPEAIVWLAVMAKTNGDRGLLEQSLARARPLRARLFSLDLLADTPERAVGPPERQERPKAAPFKKRQELLRSGEARSDLADSRAWPPPCLRSPAHRHRRSPTAS